MLCAPNKTIIEKRLFRTCKQTITKYNSILKTFNVKNTLHAKQWHGNKTDGSGRSDVIVTIIVTSLEGKTNFLPSYNVKYMPSYNIDI